MTPKEALEDWHDYFQKEIAAGIIDRERFGKMSQKAINLFFDEPTKKEKVMARIEKKLKENTQALRATKKVIKNLCQNKKQTRIK